MAKLYDAVSGNRLKSRLLIAVLFVLVLAAGAAFGYLSGSGWLGLGFAFIIAAAYVAGGYYFSDSIVLSISGAREVEKKEYPYLYNTVEAVAIGAGVPLPKMYVIEDEAPNAFATGRDPQHAAIAVTTGLLDRMNRAELEGVVGHEMAHIKNLDTRFATMAVVMVGVVSIMGDLAYRMLFYGGGRRDGRGGGSGNALLIVVALAFIILAPIAAELVRLAISRKREYLADATGVMITRHPDGLISALEKLRGEKKRVERASDATASLYFVNPLPNKLAGLFSTHPQIDDRVKELKAM